MLWGCDFASRTATGIDAGAEKFPRRAGVPRKKGKRPHAKRAGAGRLRLVQGDERLPARVQKSSNCSCHLLAAVKI
jgi:hypothetical protein